MYIRFFYYFNLKLMYPLIAVCVKFLLVHSPVYIIDQYKDLKNQSFKLFDDMKTAPGQIFYMIQSVEGFRLWFNKFMFKNAYI